MDTIYLDNAATTFIDEQVIKIMSESMLKNNGNPSSTHQFGRKAKSSIETARKNIAKHFNATASEIIFTASGTEADNLILHNAVTNLGIQTIITSKIEHYAVLRTVNHLKEAYNISVIYVNIDEFGSIDLQHLNEILIATKTKTLVSLMYVNNEIGTILPIDKVSEICKKHRALFHSDTVQAIGYHTINLQEIPIDFITASAHKFHGPKGIGFAYFKKGFGIKPILHGGNQEKGARASTENVHSILGMEKALEMAFFNIEKKVLHLTDLKSYFIDQLKKNIPKITFNGLSKDLNKSSYKILSVCFPIQDNMLLFSLDLVGIAASGGSACQSGSNKGSHVLNTFLNKEDAQKPSARFSFSKNTTKQEIDITVKKIQTILKEKLF